MLYQLRWFHKNANKGTAFFESYNMFVHDFKKNLYFCNHY